MAVMICIGILALLQGAVIGYLWRLTKTRPLTHLVKGQVVNVSIERTMGRTIGRIEFQDTKGPTGNDSSAH